MRSNVLRDGVSACLMLSLFCCLVAGVFMRYGVGVPSTWLDELSVVIFLWAIFWPATWLRNDEHIRFDMVLGALPPTVAGKLQALGYLVSGLLIAWAVPAIWSYQRFLSTERTPALQWRMDLVYACFGLFLASALIRLLLGSATSILDGRAKTAGVKNTQPPRSNGAAQ